MNVREFSDKFDTLLDTYSRSPQFGLGTNAYNITVDEYEKSVFLTQAQKNLVSQYYSGRNDFNAAFEEKEEMREALDSLVHTITPAPIDNTELAQNYIHAFDGKHTYTFYQAPEDLMYIIFEEVKFSSYICGGKSAVVVPTTHDELWYKTQNPFRGPSTGRVLRVNAEDNLIELVSDYPIGSYLLRYVEEPKPIILTDLPDGLSIDGISTLTECKLPASIHHRILNDAVALAIQSKLISQKAAPQDNRS